MLVFHSALIHIVQFAGAVRAYSDAMGATGIRGTRSHGDLARNPWQLTHSHIKE
jgi:tRNA G26 N,N-dimethylase Trm1